jgi:hypothetical protein
VNTRTRVLILLALSVGLILHPAHAAADEQGGTPPLGARDLELLPLNKLERYELARAEPELALRLATLVKRAEKLRALRAERADPTDAAGRALASQLRAVQEELAPLLAVVVEKARPHGLDDALLRHLARAPDGPLRVTRYALGLVLAEEGLPEGPRALLADVLPRVEGALLALEGERRRLGADKAGASLAPESGRVLDAALRARLARIEKRAWRLVDYVVPEAVRAAANRRLPTPYQEREGIVQHLYALPDLTVAQGARIKALLTEVEAESAPEAAAIRRSEARLREEGLDEAVRRALRADLDAAQERAMALQRHALDTARTILTGAQWQALEAIPPRVGPGDRKETSVQLLAGVALDDAQRARLDTLRAGLADARREFQERRIAVAARAAAYGPDSPQMAGMQMEMANVEAQGNVVQRAFNGRLLIELLSPEQVLAWVVETPAEP